MGSKQHHHGLLCKLVQGTRIRTEEGERCLAITCGSRIRDWCQQKSHRRTSSAKNGTWYKRIGPSLTFLMMYADHFSHRIHLWVSLYADRSFSNVSGPTGGNGAPAPCSFGAQERTSSQTPH